MRAALRPLVKPGVPLPAASAYPGHYALVRSVVEGLRAIDFSTDNWVYQGSDADIRFKPVRVDGLAEGLLWRHGRRHLLMSGTVISPQNLAETLGIESYAYVEMPSTFAAVRRPVIVRPVADMSRKATLASERGNYATMGA